MTRFILDITQEFVSMVATAEAPQLKSFMHRRRPVLNAIAIAYALCGYLIGLILIFQTSLWANIPGVILLTHSLIIAAYLTHEMMHSNIFADHHWNATWGTVMLWLTGSCYTTFSHLKAIHMSHHIDRVDFSNFDLAETISSLSKPIRWLVLTLEWCYLPVITVWQVWQGVINLWREEPNQRPRILLTFLVRVSVLALLGWFFPKTFLLYIIAYVGMLNFLRWMDAFHHTFEVFPAGTRVIRTHEHEQTNTFTNLISLRHPWLNLLALNFGYHNAHHEVMTCPWHSLPELDRTLYQGDEVQYIPVSLMLGNYHRFRIKRIFAGQGQAVDDHRQLTPDLFYGAVGVSFLTAL